MYIVGSNLKPRGYHYGTLTPSQCTLYLSVNGGAAQNLGQYTTYRSMNYADVDGYDVPNYKARLRSGELLPQTPFRKLTRIGECTDGHFDYTYFDGSVHKRHWMVPDMYYSQTQWQVTEEQLFALVDSDTTKHVTAAAAKIYSSGFDALTWLAELKDMRRLWSSIAEKLLYLKKDLFRGRLSLRFAERIRSISSEWLSYRYGWRQLVKDFQGLSKAIDQLNDKRSRYSERSGYTQTSTTSTTETLTSQYLDWNLTVSDKVTIGCRGSVVADIEIPAFQFNPLLTAWEVIPLSFVLDWFVNVGKTLSAISFLATVKQYSASAGSYVRIERQMEKSVKTYKAGYEAGSITQIGSSVGEYEIRTPCRVPYFPRFALNMDRWKVLDLVGLIIQRLK